MSPQVKSRAWMICGLIALVAAFPPAVASAGPEWQRGASPPGSGDFAVVDGALTVAYASPAGVRVASRDRDGSWTQIGAPIRHASNTPVYTPSIAEGPEGLPWVAWTETDDTTVTQARVAKFDGENWQEVVGGDRPINITPPAHWNTTLDAFTPDLVFFEGTPYVAYVQDNTSETDSDVVRLKADGSAWERIAPAAYIDDFPHLVVSGGRLYFTSKYRWYPGLFIFRLRTDRTGWEPQMNYENADDIRLGIDPVDVGGAPATTGLSNGERVIYSLGADDVWGEIGAGPYASVGGVLAGLDGVAYVAWIDGAASPRSVHAAYAQDGAWTPLPSPSDEGIDTSGLRLVSGAGDLYAIWSAEEESGLVTHVARLGASAPPPPADNGDGHGQGTPSGPAEPDPPVPAPPTPAPTGQCAHLVGGTLVADVLRGTRRSDRISGRAGNDRLFGFAAGDCLFGGAGADLLRGGSGKDDLNGNAGNDVIFAGPGRDEVAAGSGNDRVDVRGGGSDLVACGSGRDTVVIDRNDATRGCERVRVR